MYQYVDIVSAHYQNSYALLLMLHFKFIIYTFFPCWWKLSHYTPGFLKSTLSYLDLDMPTVAIGVSFRNWKYLVKQCKSWWDGSWAISSGSTLFALFWSARVKQWKNKKKKRRTYCMIRVDTQKIKTINEQSTVYLFYLCILTVRLCKQCKPRSRSTMFVIYPVVQDTALVRKIDFVQIWEGI